METATPAIFNYWLGPGAEYLALKVPLHIYSSVLETSGYSNWVLQLHLGRNDYLCMNTYMHIYIYILYIYTYMHAYIHISCMDTNIHTYICT